MICRGLCACTEMLGMCVLYVSLGSKVRPRTFRCVAMGSALLFIAKLSSSLCQCFLLSPCSYILSLILLYFHSLMFHFQLCLLLFFGFFTF